MEVETYEAIERETGEQAPEMEAEAIEIIEALGLEGQKKLVTPDDTGEKRRNPYRRWAAEEQRVYGVLLPEFSTVEGYDAGPIPLRVLQVASHAREFFHNLYVMHQAESVDEDPLLIGMMEKRTTWGGWPKDTFILARWGRVLRPFEELREMAKKAWTSQTLARAKQSIAQLEQVIAGIEGHAEDYVAGRDAPDL